jgi:hypothetical protein
VRLSIVRSLLLIKKFPVVVLGICSLAQVIWLRPCRSWIRSRFIPTDWAMRGQRRHHIMLIA